MGMEELGISREACLAITISAIEVFPKECIGTTFSSNGKRIDVALPFQAARRTANGVTSDSILISDQFRACMGFLRSCGYHSHPYQSKEADGPVEPSKTDLENIDVGEIEIITNIRKSRNNSESISCKDGVIHVEFRRYRFKISAFVRLEGKTKEGPLHERVTLFIAED